MEIPEIPESLWPLRDAAIDYAIKGGEEPDIKALHEWFEVDGWDAIIAGWNYEALVIKLYYLAWSSFEDDEFAALEDIEVNEITDAMRLKYARDLLEKASSGEDDYLCPSVHSCKIERENGDSAILGSYMEIHGQGGPVVTWWGIFKDDESFIESLKQSDHVLIDEIDIITDEKILSLWKKAIL